jgi:SAM-dependent methyltransferase
LDAPKLDIDTDAPDDQLSFMIAKIKEAWSHLGKTRPFFSVLTNPKFLPDEFERNAKEYWDSGEREAGRVQRMLERHGFDLANKTCVEYGCGTGRVTMGLAKRCAHVHAYDISLGNMKHGKQRAKEIGIGNITFHEISDIVGMLEPCDFFYSRIVFQHNPPPVITRLVEKALGSLNSEGIAIFQVPTYLFGYRFEIDEWIKADHALDMQMHCLPQRRIFEIIAQGGCVPLEIMEDGSTGSTKFRSNTFIIRKSI